MKTILFTLLIIFLFSCVSEQEKQEYKSKQEKEAARDSLNYLFIEKSNTYYLITKEISFIINNNFNNETNKIDSLSNEQQKIFKEIEKITIKLNLLFNLPLKKIGDWVWYIQTLFLKRKKNLLETLIGKYFYNIKNVKTLFGVSGLIVPPLIGII